MKSTKLFKIVLVLSACISAVSGQESLGTYQIRVAPDRDNWTYELNEKSEIRRIRDAQ